MQNHPTISVATLYNTSLSAPVGPSRNIGRIYSNKKLFAGEGISLLGPYCPAVAVDRNVSDVSKGHKQSVSNSIKRTLRKTVGGNLFLFWYTQVRNSNKVVKQLVNENSRVDLVVIRDLVTAYTYAKSKLTIPYIIVMHNDGSENMFFSDSAFPKLSKKPFGNLLTHIFNYAYRNAAGILFLSEVAVNKFKSNHPDIQCTFGIYHQGLSMPECVNKLEIAKSSILYVTVGTVSKRKNQSAIIRSLANLSDKNAKLVIVGDGDDLAECKLLAESLGIGDRVIFTGKLDNVGDALGCADVYVSASFDEGLSNAAVEAMSWSMPLILTDVGASRDLIADNGYLIPCGDDESLLSAMEAFVQKPDELRLMGEASRRLYKRYYTVEKMCLEHAGMYRRTYLAKKSMNNE